MKGVEKLDVGVDIDKVRDWILDTVEDAGYDAIEFSYVGIRAYGSRIGAAYYAKKGDKEVTVLVFSDKTEAQTQLEPLRSTLLSGVSCECYGTLLVYGDALLVSYFKI